MLNSFKITIECFLLEGENVSGHKREWVKAATLRKKELVENIITMLEVPMQEQARKHLGKQDSLNYLSRVDGLSHAGNIS